MLLTMGSIPQNQTFFPANCSGKTKNKNFNSINKLKRMANHSRVWMRWRSEEKLKGNTIFALTVFIAIAELILCFLEEQIVNSC